MKHASYADYDHLLHHACRLFPNSSVTVIHTDDEVIHIDVDEHRYTFEITSDDEEYVFTDGHTAFTIPLMESSGTYRISPDSPSELVLMELSVTNPRSRPT